jgi:hypothetical protein
LPLIGEQLALVRYYADKHMNAQDAIVAISALFIGGMIWLRTRTQYAHRGAGPIRLQPTGRIYFGTVIILLVVGYFTAPVIGHAIWPETAATPTLMRVVWFLAMYYIFIAVHRVLKARGKEVFSAGVNPQRSTPAAGPR